MLSAAQAERGAEDAQILESEHKNRLSELQGVRAILELIYTRWRDSFTVPLRAKGSAISSTQATGKVQAEAGLCYAEWLLLVAEDGAAASKVIRGALASCISEPALRDDVERRWSDTLAAHDAEAAKGSEDAIVDDGDNEMIVD